MLWLTAAAATATLLWANTIATQPGGESPSTRLGSGQPATAGGAGSVASTGPAAATSPESQPAIIVHRYTFGPSETPPAEMTQRDQLLVLLTVVLFGAVVIGLRYVRRARQGQRPPRI